MYEIDDLANVVPMAGQYDQLALVDDIQQNGQTESAVLWQGKIVDGRCRQLACTTLGIELKVRELDSSLVRDEVEAIVKSLNTRRNLTVTQKCMSAFKAQETCWITNEEVAKKWAIPLGTYKNARYVGTHRGEYVEPLFDGKSVKVYDPDKGMMVTTNKINTLARIIKKTKEAGTVVVDDSEKVSFSVEGVLKTEEAKDWYYSTMSLYKSSADPSVFIGMLLTELANLKFKEQENESV